MPTVLTKEQRTLYERDGFIVVPDVFSAAEIDALRRVTDGFVARSVAVAANDDVYDLEDTHSVAAPRVRRLKAPHLIDPAYFRPTEVETLCGDSSKARQRLGWRPDIGFEDMVREMVEEDLRAIGSVQSFRHE